MKDKGREIDLDQIRSIFVEYGYEVTQADGHLRVKDLDSGIVIRAVLEQNILFNAVVLMTVEDRRITPEISRRMLDAGNGIATSFFQLYADSAAGRTSVTLNNFCKLQSLSADDIDDMLSCLEFLEIDAFAARELLSDALG
jgi:hypothetical protein